MRTVIADILASVDAIESFTLDEALTIIDRIREKSARQYMIGNALVVECSDLQITVKEDHRERQPGMFLVPTDLSIKIDGEEWGGNLCAATLRIRPNDAVMLDLERIVH
jgi:hypothetical protein